jgi:DNA polymerase-3 subunit epsilon
MREIVLDTETTGLDPYQGDRLVEIGCVELYNKIPTGQNFHCYINPGREMSASAFEVHGLSTEFLKGKPLFTEVADDFLTFIGEAPLVAHNAAFDLGFLNAELERAAKPVIGSERMIDTLLLARRKHPAGPNRLDDLCVRYGVDNSRRTKHGALLDAEILAEVYIELIGARQAELGLEEARAIGTADTRTSAIRIRPVPLLPRIAAEEREAHAAFVASLGANAIWRDYLAAGEERKAAAG